MAKLTWGVPCRAMNHQIEDGTNLRWNSYCALCHDRFKDTTMTQQQVFELLSTKLKKPKRTVEEIKALRVAASMRWNAKNKDKTRIYTQKYLSREEVKEANKIKSKEKWSNMPKDERVRKARMQYLRILLNKTDITEEDIVNYDPKLDTARIENRRERQRIAYSKKTQEQKASDYEKAKIRNLKKQTKETNELN